MEPLVKVLYKNETVVLLPFGKLSGFQAFNSSHNAPSTAEKLIPKSIDLSPIGEVPLEILKLVINFFTLEKLPFNSASLPSDLDGLCLMLQICEDLSHVNRKFLRQILFSKIKQMLQKDIILLVKLLKKSPLMPALTNLCMSLLELHIVPLSIYFPQSLAEIDFSIFKRVFYSNTLAAISNDTERVLLAWKYCLLNKTIGWFSELVFMKDSESLINWYTVEINNLPEEIVSHLKLKRSVNRIKNWKLSNFFPLDASNIFARDDAKGYILILRSQEEHVTEGVFCSLELNYDRNTGNTTIILCSKNTTSFDTKFFLSSIIVSNYKLASFCSPTLVFHANAEKKHYIMEIKLKTLLDNDLIVQDYYNSKIRSQYLTDNVPSLVPPSKGLLVIINAYHQRENPLERVETVVSDFSKNLRKIRCATEGVYKSLNKTLVPSMFPLLLLPTYDAPPTVPNSLVVYFWHLISFDGKEFSSIPAFLAIKDVSLLFIYYPPHIYPPEIPDIPSYKVGKNLLCGIIIFAKNTLPITLSDDNTVSSPFLLDSIGRIKLFGKFIKLQDPLKPKLFELTTDSALMKEYCYKTPNLNSISAEVHLPKTKTQAPAVARLTITVANLNFPKEKRENSNAQNIHDSITKLLLTNEKSQFVYIYVVDPDIFSVVDSDNASPVTDIFVALFGYFWDLERNHKPKFDNMHRWFNIFCKWSVGHGYAVDEEDKSLFWKVGTLSNERPSFRIDMDSIFVNLNRVELFNISKYFTTPACRDLLEKFVLQGKLNIEEELTIDLPYVKKFASLMKHLAILLDRDQAASPVTPNFTHPSPTPPEMPMIPHQKNKNYKLGPKALSYSTSSSTFDFRFVKSSGATTGHVPISFAERGEDICALHGSYCDHGTDACMDLYRCRKEFHSDSKKIRDKFCDVHGFGNHYSFDCFSIKSLIRRDALPFCFFHNHTIDTQTCTNENCDMIKALVDNSEKPDLALFCVLHQKCNHRSEDCGLISKERHGFFYCELHRFNRTHKTKDCTKILKLRNRKKTFEVCHIHNLGKHKTENCPLVRTMHQLLWNQRPSNSEDDMGDLASSISSSSSVSIINEERKKEGKEKNLQKKSVSFVDEEPSKGNSLLLQKGIGDSILKSSSAQSPFNEKRKQRASPPSSQTPVEAEEAGDIIPPALVKPPSSNVVVVMAEKEKSIRDKPPTAIEKSKAIQNSPSSASKAGDIIPPALVKPAASKSFVLEKNDGAVAMVEKSKIVRDKPPTAFEKPKLIQNSPSSASKAADFIPPTLVKPAASKSFVLEKIDGVMVMVEKSKSIRSESPAAVEKPKTIPSSLPSASKAVDIIPSTLVKPMVSKSFNLETKNGVAVVEKSKIIGNKSSVAIEKPKPIPHPSSTASKAAGIIPLTHVKPAASIIDKPPTAIEKPNTIKNSPSSAAKAGDIIPSPLVKPVASKSFVLEKKNGVVVEKSKIIRNESPIAIEKAKSISISPSPASAIIITKKSPPANKKPPAEKTSEIKSANISGVRKDISLEAIINVSPSAARLSLPSSPSPIDPRRHISQLLDNSGKKPGTSEGKFIKNAKLETTALISNKHIETPSSSSSTNNYNSSSANGINPDINREGKKRPRSKSTEEVLARKKQKQEEEARDKRKPIDSGMTSNKRPALAPNFIEIPSTSSSEEEEDEKEDEKIIEEVVPSIPLELDMPMPNFIPDRDEWTDHVRRDWRNGEMHGKKNEEGKKKIVDWEEHLKRDWRRG